MNADNVCPGARDLLSRNSTDNGVIAIDGGCNTASKGGRNTLMASGGSPGRVTQVSRHKEVLIGSSAGQWRYRWDQGGWGLGRGAVGNTRNIGDLNDVGSAGEDSGCDGVG